MFGSEVTCGLSMWLGEGGSCCGILCHVMRCCAMSVVSCRARWCNVMSCNWMEWDGMWLCDAVIWEMMCCELWRTHVPAKPWRRPFQCDSNARSNAGMQDKRRLRRAHVTELAFRLQDTSSMYHKVCVLSSM